MQQETVTCCSGWAGYRSVGGEQLYCASVVWIFEGEVQCLLVHLFNFIIIILLFYFYLNY